MESIKGAGGGGLECRTWKTLRGPGEGVGGGGLKKLIKQRLTNT